MIEIYTDQDTQGSTKKMTAKFYRDENNAIIITECTMDKGLTNRLSKQRQKEVKKYLDRHAGVEFEVRDNSVIELIFRDDQTKVRVVFKQEQPKD